MEWNAIQKDIKAYGYLLYAMSQGQTDVATMPGPWGNAYSGYCAGVAVRWIALRYGGSDYAYNHETQVLELPDWRTTRDQNTLEDTKGVFPDNLAPAFALYGLTL